MANKIEKSIESLLLVATKPLKIKKIKQLLEKSSDDDIKKAIDNLKEKYNNPESGFRLLENGNALQLSTSPEASDLIKDFVKDETTGELTKPSLETLTIIAYRQPISKAELEQIRGVNCSMILRNLMIRGLVIAKEDKRMLNNYYYVTMDFLKFLGINSVTELPDYEKLNNNPHLKKLLSSEDEDEEFIEEENEAESDTNKEEQINKSDNKQEDDDNDKDQDDKPEDKLKVNIYK